MLINNLLIKTHSLVLEIITAIIIMSGNYYDNNNYVKFIHKSPDLCKFELEAA